LNQAITELLNQWLHRQMKGYGKSRQELFVTLDKPAHAKNCALRSYSLNERLSGAIDSPANDQPLKGRQIF